MTMITLLLAFTAAVTDPMEWLYPDSEVEKVNVFSETDVPADGTVDANILLNGLKPGEPVRLEASVAGGEWCEMLSVPVEYNSGHIYFVEKPGETNEFVVRRAPYRVYDALKPLAGAEFTPTSSVAGVRFAIDAKKLAAAKTALDFVICHDGSCEKLSLLARVHPAKSAADCPAEEFRYVNWASFRNMADRHGLERWSDAHYAMIDRYIALAVRNRQNAVWLPNEDMFVAATEDGVENILATNRLDRLMEIFNRNHVQWIEGGHLCGRGEGGWKSTNLVVRGIWKGVDRPEAVAEFQTQCEQIMGFIRRHHLEKRWLQHVMDEPVQCCMASYYRACGIVRRFMPSIPLLDAVELPGFEGALDIVCPKDYMWQQNQDSFEYARTNCGQHVWCYTCCAPGGKWMNRLLDGELLRPLYMFATADSKHIEGYLHWGYNHWQEQQDPFNMSCITNWGGVATSTLPAGDTHIVYPGDNGPWSGVRLEATRQGMEDCELFRKLRARDPKRADELLSRIARAFDDYETDVRKYRQVRRELLEAIR